MSTLSLLQSPALNPKEGSFYVVIHIRRREKSDSIKRERGVLLTLLTLL